MAISNEQVLAAISAYRAEHERPCPARYLVDLLGGDDTVSEAAVG